jgi:NADH-quinone oxidoreductase subunit L
MSHVPISWYLMLSAVLFALGIAVNFPGFSGFFSKDAILAAAFDHAPWMLWVGVVTPGLTAFYVFRAFFLCSAAEHGAQFISVINTLSRP